MGESLSFQTTFIPESRLKVTSMTLFSMDLYCQLSILTLLNILREELVRTKDEGPVRWTTYVDFIVEYVNSDVLVRIPVTPRSS